MGLRNLIFIGLKYIVVRKTKRVLRYRSGLGLNLMEYFATALFYMTILKTVKSSAYWNTSGNGKLPKMIRTTYLRSQICCTRSCNYLLNVAFKVLLLVGLYGY